LGQRGAFGFDAQHDAGDALGHGAALFPAQGLAPGGIGVVDTQVFLDLVEALDLAQKPAGQALAQFKGLVELAPGVRPAGSQFDRAIASVGHGAIGAVAVALNLKTAVEKGWEAMFS
jgi:hypothetical protein